MRTDGLIELPDGSAIFYDDPSHAYYRANRTPIKQKRVGGIQDLRPADAALPEPSTQGPEWEWSRGRRLTGASTLAKPFNYDSGRLMAWKERVTCEAIAEAYGYVDGTVHPEDLGWLRDGDTIRKHIRQAGTDADSIRDKKAALGTNVHTVLESLATGKGYEMTYPSEEEGYMDAVMDWWEKRKPEVLNVEQFVYSASHGYAGRFDLRCILPDYPGGKALVDLKTSSYIGAQYHVQLALYDLAARECGVGGSDDLFILQVKPDGTWKEVKCVATHNDALAAIQVYRGVARIEREAKAA